MEALKDATPLMVIGLAVLYLAKFAYETSRRRNGQAPSTGQDIKRVEEKLSSFRSTVMTRDLCEAKRQVTDQEVAHVRAGVQDVKAAVGRVDGKLDRVLDEFRPGKGARP